MNYPDVSAFLSSVVIYHIAQPHSLLYTAPYGRFFVTKKYKLQEFLEALFILDAEELW